MQAIVVKFLPPTNYKGSRLKAECERGSVTIDYHEASGTRDAKYWEACKALVARFVREDVAKYGEEDERGNPWRGPWHCGETKDHRTVFVNSRFSDGFSLERSA